MPNPCSVCKHPDRKAIDRLMLTGTVSNRAVARQYGVSKDAVARHRPHITASLVKAHEATEVAHADSLLGDVRDREGRADRLYAHAEDILDRSKKAEDLKTALRAIGAGVDVLREARAHMELRGTLTGELEKNKPTIHAEQAVILLPTVDADGATRLLGLAGRPALGAPAVKTQE